ncbi:MAG: hypothetical protein IT577_18150 [Verrucomicrobiae bacterium]|nr:hypothetical protein [Verrucomicrobiae bacterium]
MFMLIGIIIPVSKPTRVFICFIVCFIELDQVKPAFVFTGIPWPIAKNGLDDGPKPRHSAGMKNQKTNRPARTSITVLRRLCNPIPSRLVPKLAREHGAGVRVFSPWSHVAAVFYAQMSHAIGLNDARAMPGLFSGPFSIPQARWLSRKRNLLVLRTSAGGRAPR